MKWLTRFFKRLFRRKPQLRIADPVPVQKANEFENPYYAEYLKLFNSMEITQSPEWYLKIINKNKSYYLKAAEIVKCPWEVIAIIHCLECGGDMSRQILNGEKWNAKTKLVPKNMGPFKSFEESCLVGMELHKKYIPDVWGVGNMLYFFEAWNGFGYRTYRGINSPYLWSFSNHYTSGKYVADGKYDPSAVSKQCGAAVILKALLDL